MKSPPLAAAELRRAVAPPPPRMFEASSPSPASQHERDVERPDGQEVAGRARHHVDPRDVAGRAVHRRSRRRCTGRRLAERGVANTIVTVPSSGRRSAAVVGAVDTRSRRCVRRRSSTAAPARPRPAASSRPASPQRASAPRHLPPPRRAQRVRCFGERLSRAVNVIVLLTPVAARDPHAEPRAGSQLLAAHRLSRISDSAFLPALRLRVLNLQPLPWQRTARARRRRDRRAPGRRRSVTAPMPRRTAAPPPGTRANGSATPSQSSSTGCPSTSSAPGWIARSRVVAVEAGRKPSRSRSVSTASAPSQFWSPPSPGGRTRPGATCRRGRCSRAACRRRRRRDRAAGPALDLAVLALERRCRCRPLWRCRRRRRTRRVGEPVAGEDVSLPVDAEVAGAVEAAAPVDPVRAVAAGDRSARRRPL